MFAAHEEQGYKELDPAWTVAQDTAKQSFGSQLPLDEKEIALRMMHQTVQHHAEASKYTYNPTQSDSNLYVELLC